MFYFHRLRSATETVNGQMRAMPRSKRKSKPQAQVETCVGDTINKQDEVQAFRIEEAADVGKYLVASRDLNVGQLILAEAPLVVGPSQDTAAVCIGCYDSVDISVGTPSRCEKCSFPICCKKCSGIGKKTGHSLEECSLLAKTPIKNMSSHEISQCYNAITPLRCLILKNTEPNGWKRLMEMEAHTNIRRTIKSLWSYNQRNVVDVIRGKMNLEEFEEEIIHKVCGILEVNAFEVGQGLRAIYPTAYIFAHDCVPNVRHSEDKDFNLTFWTTIPLVRGSRLNVTYTYILQGTLGRRKHIKDTKFFDCRCARCADASELGTNASALKCPMCRNGLVETTDPLNEDADWMCNSKKCVGYVVTAASVKKMTQQIFLELDAIDGNDIAGYENFIRKHTSTLHERHFLLLSAMHCLYQLYGKIEGFMINDLSEDQLNRKADLCRTLLSVFEKLEPGQTKQKGLINYELQACLMVLLQRKLQKQTPGKLEMKLKLREITKCLENSIQMLRVEPEGSNESQMVSAAKDALGSLR